MTALTIAGFDPSSGAGITADLQVFAAHGVFGISAITALTIQSTLGVLGSAPVPDGHLAKTLETLQQDLPPDGIKIGMLGGASQVKEVALYLRAHPGRPVVLDPVLRSSSGATLLSDEGLRLLREELLPLATVITPNIAELAVLSGAACTTAQEQRAAAESLSAQSGTAVIVTGGDSPEASDDVFADGQWTHLRGAHIESNSTHGTGCAFSTAVLCGLLHGQPVTAAAAAAKQYVVEAIRTATPRGQGKGPMNLLWSLKPTAAR